MIKVSHSFEVHSNESACRKSEHLGLEQVIDIPKKAKEIYQYIGNTPLRDYKATIKMNAITNCPVTLHDIKLLEQFFVPYITTIKEK